MQKSNKTASDMNGFYDEIQKLRSMLSLVMSDKNWELLQSMGKTVRGRSLGTEIDQPQSIQLKVKSVTSVGTQTEEQGTVSLEREVHIGAINNYEEFVKAERLKWPSKVYKNAFMAMGTPLKVGGETDLVYLVEEDDVSTKYNDGVRRMFVDRFPGIENLDDNSSVLTISTKIESRDGVQMVKERWIYKVELGGGHPEEWYNNLIRIRNKMIEEDRSRIAVCPPTNDISGTRTRKMME